MFQLASVFTKEDTLNTPTIKQHFPDMPNIVFNAVGVEKLLKNINPDIDIKATGPDHIPAKILKEAAHELAPMYCHLFQQSYKSAELPKTWKSANIFPVN